MLIEAVENYYRELSAERNSKPQNWHRASSLGYCPRRLGYQKLGVVGDPLTPRRLSIFHHGDAIDLAIKQDLYHALKGEIITANHRGSVEIEGVEISGECDGFFHIDGRYGVVDGKTMSDFGFERALNGQIEESYQVQGWVYSQIYGVDLVVFYCYRKETSHIVEVIFDARVPETIITRRFGGDEREIATKDPLLIAEVRTPFSPGIEAKARATVVAVNAVTCEADLPGRIEKNDRGEPIIQAETVKVQGAGGADAYQDANPGHINTGKAGSWYTFETGRRIAGFPCSYCPFIRRCRSAVLEVKGGKPVWLVNGKEGLFSGDTQQEVTAGALG